MVGIHTVFIAKENILFLKEWILYHKYMGIEHFFLYDNSGGDGYFDGRARSPSSRGIGRTSTGYPMTAWLRSPMPK